MAVFWGSLAAVLIGVSDLVLIRSSDKAHIVTIMVLVSAGGVLTGFAALLVVDSTIRLGDMALGALAGMSMGAALALYVVSMRATSVSVTSPIVAVLNSLWPFGYGVLINDETPERLAIAGVALGLLSLVVTTWSPESTGNLARGVALALLSGTAYGLGNILLGNTSEASGMWPAVTHRSAGVVMFLVVAAVVGLPRLAPPSVRLSPLVAGFLGTGALVAFLIGVQGGSLSIVSVSMGMFPAVSVGLLHLFAGHPLRWWQAVGIGGAITGVAVIAVA
ncbi:MAG: multidrug transporter [Acidimicrobiales bacterium]|nr:MAG: multidrug transporter [Acidimicrobiales bacterium]